MPMKCMTLNLARQSLYLMRSCAILNVRACRCFIFFVSIKFHTGLYESRTFLFITHIKRLTFDTSLTDQDGKGNAYKNYIIIIIIRNDLNNDVCG